ncbi:MAG TPA: hypothetical protein VIM11_09975 [Tepidisphaeraceae bacterium]|jgi:hypothetical protein
MADLSTASSTDTATHFSFRQRLMEIDMFFQGTDRVHQTMRRVANYLDKSGISHAIVGDMAVNAHHHERTTKDVDFLLTSDGFAAFRKVADDGKFDPVPGRPRRFIDRTTNVTFDVLVTGYFPGSGKPGPISYPDPLQVAQKMDELQVVDLPTLIQLKLAAHRYQDFADVVNLIGANQLDELFQDRLHTSVRADYIECLEEKRREDEYEARQDRAMDGEG